MFGWSERFRCDLREVSRSLRHETTFAVAASITFAVGVGANIAVFSIVDRLLFRPFPFVASDRLVQVHLFTNGIDAPIAAAFLPYEVTAALRHASSFEGLAFTGGWTDATAPSPGENPLLLTPVSANALEVLGVRPVIGRGFVPTDDEPGSDIAVLLAHEVWRDRFGGAADVLARTWGDPKRRYRVVGVLPPGFFFPSSHLVGVSAGLSVLKTNIVADRLTIAPVARLTANATVETAQAEVDLAVRQQEWRNASLRRNAAAGRLVLSVQPLRDGLTLVVGRYMWLASSAVWIVLAVACVNLSTLLLMRGYWRRREAAVRAALGASPARLMGLGCLEALVLCVSGAGLAWLAYIWSAQGISAIMPPILRGLATTPFDPRVVGMTVLAATVSALIATAAPALAMRRLDLVNLLRGEECAGSYRGWLPGGRLLLGMQAAFGVMVAVGASIMVPGFVRLILEPPGFSHRDLFTVMVNHDWPNGSDSPTLRAERHRVILDVLHTLPNIRHAAASLPAPFENSPANSQFWESHGAAGRQFAVGPGIFEVLRSHLRAGREFSMEDRADAVAIVNESGARVLWPGVPLTSVPGRVIDNGPHARTVLGVVTDIRSRPGAPVTPDLFLPFLASDSERLQSALPMVVRMAPGAVPDVGWLTRRLNEHFPRNGVSIGAVTDQLEPFLVRPRFLGLLFGGAGALVLLLVGVGVYAVASVETATRRRETAIRLALGASPAQIRCVILFQVIGPVMTGTAMGLFLARTGVRTLQPWIKEMATAPPGAYFAAGVLMISVAVAAVLWPIRRVSMSEPWSDLGSS